MGYYIWGNGKTNKTMEEKMTSKKMTVNQAMSLMKLVRTKKTRLEALQHQVATSEKTWMNEVVKEVTPQYDFSKLDGIIAQYEKFLFKTDAAIKQSNAVTEIEVEESVDTLLDALP